MELLIIIYNFEEKVDIRHFHLMYEYKKTMVSRLEYLVEKKVPEDLLEALKGLS